jgi:hypothetical protein
MRRALALPILIAAGACARDDGRSDASGTGLATADSTGTGNPDGGPTKADAMAQLQVRYGCDVGFDPAG